MKICPRCQKTYTDDNLNFCLEDGSVLTQMPGQVPPTVAINAVPTHPQQQYASQPGGQPGFGMQPQAYVQPAKPKSRTWVWALLILAVLALLCGGGLVGFLAYVGSQANRAANTFQNTSANKSLANRTANSKTSSNSASNSNSSRTDVTELDLQMFVKTDSPYGTTDLNDGELTMGAKQKGYYYALAAPAEYQTEDADTSVTLRNVDNASSSLGYGLIFHSNTIPLQQDYAFLIDTKKKKYRVVHHSPGQELPVIGWTTSNAIRDGSDQNTLEVRDNPDKIDLYINGTLVNSIRNTYGYPNGVAGLYSGDGVKIAFKDLQIRK